MNDPRAEFMALLQPVLERSLRQCGRPVPAAAVLVRLGDRLWGLLAERGVPPPRAAGATGAAAELSAETVAPLVERLLADCTEVERAALVNPARQLVKACFQGDLAACRESYREVTSDGSCRRQELKRVRDRISGTHCVDCPHWLDLTPAEHGPFLARAWGSGNAAEFAAHRDVFLPEDFRALRRFVRRGLAPNRS